MGGGGMGDGSTGAGGAMSDAGNSDSGLGATSGVFGFTTDPNALLALQGKEALHALQDLTPVVTKTMQVYSDMMYNLIKTSDRRNDSLSVEHEEQQQDLLNLDTKLMTFQAEMDTSWREQETTNNEWDKRMRKVEAVISGLPAWKEETVNLIRENKRADDTRYSEMLGRLQDLENDYAVVKEDVTSRLVEVEEGKEKAANQLRAAERRIVALEEDMKRRISDIAKVSEEATNKFAETEESIGAIKLSFSRFNHEFKLLEASHEDLKGQLEQDVFKLSEQLQLAGQERAQLGHDIMTVKSSVEDGDTRLHDRVDALQPALNDLEALKADLGGMRTELEATMGDMDDMAPPPPTVEASSVEGSPRTPPEHKKAKLKMLAKMAVKTAGTKSRDGSAQNSARGGVAGGLSYMMNYLKERIEGMSEHTIEQDQEIGDLQTRTGEIVLDLMRLRKTEDDMVTVKTTIREHKDLISRNKTDLSNSVARQAEEDQQIYALMEKKASETQKHVKMDVKAAKAELKSLNDNNMTAIKEINVKIRKLSGEVQDKDKGDVGMSIDSDTVKMIHDSAKTVAEMQGKIILAEGHIEAHEQRLTDQGAQIYDLSAKVLTELEKELNGIRDDIQDKTSMLHREVLLRPTETDVKDIFTALKMGMMGETASYELKSMMERLLHASKGHLLGHPTHPGHSGSGRAGSGRASTNTSVSGAASQVPGTPDNNRVPHLAGLEKPPQQGDDPASLVQSMQERLDQLVDRPHSCVDSLVLYTYLLTARMDSIAQHNGLLLKKLAIVQKEAGQSFDEVSKIQQMSSRKSDTADSKQVKRLENAIRELARITLSSDRDSVLLGSVSRDQKGEFFKCLSCDNHPISIEDLQRNSPSILPSLGAATPQPSLGRDSKAFPDRMRAKTASPDRAAARGRMYTSNPIGAPGQGNGQLPDARDGSPQRAAIHSNLPTVLSTSQQMSQGLSIRMESFAPYAVMPPPQFHGRGRDMRSDIASHGNNVHNSLELPSIASAPDIHSPRPDEASAAAQ